jgi:hypothetical protein
MRIGSIARTRGPGRHDVILTRMSDDKTHYQPSYGELVRIKQPKSDHIAVVINVTALDSMGGRYDSWFEQAPGLDKVFDLEVGERITLAEVVVVGSFAGEAARHHYPEHAASLGASVESMSDTEATAFHQVNGSPSLSYYSQLQAAYMVDPTILLAVLQRAKRLVPAVTPMVEILERENAMKRWRQA